MTKQKDLVSAGLPRATVYTRTELPRAEPDDEKDTRRSNWPRRGHILSGLNTYAQSVNEYYYDGPDR